MLSFKKKGVIFAHFISLGTLSVLMLLLISGWTKVLESCFASLIDIPSKPAALFALTLSMAFLTSLGKTNFNEKLFFRIYVCLFFKATSR